MDFSRNTFLWIFVGIGVLILIAIVVSSVVMSAQLVSVSGQIKNRLKEVDGLIEKLEKSVETMEGISGGVSRIEGALITLSNKYPPEQTINVNNMNQQELNRAINNAVEVELEEVKWKINFNFVLNIAFGALLSLGGLYLIFGRKK
jgi:hypothetical protein